MNANELIPIESFEKPTNSMIYGTLSIPGWFSTGIYARDLEDMAEILKDTLPNDDPNKFFVVEVEGLGRIAFTCTGTFCDAAE